MASSFEHIRVRFLALKRQFHGSVLYFTLAVILVVLLLSILDPWVGQVLEFDREKIYGGEYWRLLTGNFVHFGFYHSVMNMISVALIGLCLFWVFPWSLWAFLVMFVALMDGIGLYFLSPDIGVYRGYSGSVYGLAIVGLVLNWRVNPFVASIVLVGLTGKLVYERMPNYDVNFLIQEIGVPVAVDAHLWGGLTGVALSLPLLFILRHYKRCDNSS